uniref:Uncharacterized protein n=1 Tax=Romanomermis culicivorax TaxID=13658 RepID=A0A915JDE1_ROMCU
MKKLLKCLILRNDIAKNSDDSATLQIFGALPPTSPNTTCNWG